MIHQEDKQAVSETMVRWCESRLLVTPQKWLGCGGQCWGPRTGWEETEGNRTSETTGFLGVCWQSLVVLKESLLSICRDCGAKTAAGEGPWGGDQKANPRSRSRRRD